MLQLHYTQPCALHHLQGLPLGARAGTGSPTHAEPEQGCTSASVSNNISDFLSPPGREPCR